MHVVLVAVSVNLCLVLWIVEYASSAAGFPSFCADNKLYVLVTTAQLVQDTQNSVPNCQPRHHANSYGHTDPIMPDSLSIVITYK